MSEKALANTTKGQGAMAPRYEDGNINVTPYTTANDFLWKTTNSEGVSQIYVKKAGKSLKLQEYANKHKGMKTISTVLVSRANEDGKEFKALYDTLPEWQQREIWGSRHGKIEMFTSPKGEALAHTLIVFGDGSKADFECVNAAKENVKMSTIHVFLDVMACTRSFNRTVGYLTANGLMNCDIIKEHDNFDYNEDDFDETEDEKEILRQLYEDGDIKDKEVDSNRECQETGAGDTQENTRNNGESFE